MSALLVLLGLKPHGSNFKTIKKKIAKLNVDCSHWTGQLWSKGESLKDWADYKINSSIKRNLLKVRGNICENCKLETWLGNPIPIEMHHIDGKITNNELSNLQLLCPNCHSFTPNFRNSKKPKEPKVKTERIRKKSFCSICSSICCYRSTKCRECYNAARISSIPSKEILEQDIIDLNHNMCAIGRKYDVTDSAIRQWIKKYNI